MQKLNKIHFFLIIIMLTYYNCEQTFNFEIQEGDLLFQDLDSSPLCDGIEQVTQGYQNMDFSHIGIVIKRNGENYVLEAFNGVDTITLEKFLFRNVNQKNQPKVVVGRLQNKYQKLIPKAIQHGMTLIGKDYDEEFKINNNKFYCSELIYEMFFVSNKNKDFFQLKPMTYKVDGVTLPIWENYFKTINIPIPENKPGINPGGISISKKLNIIYNYQKQ